MAETPEATPPAYIAYPRHPKYRGLTKADRLQYLVWGVRRLKPSLVVGFLGALLFALPWNWVMPISGLLLVASIAMLGSSLSDIFRGLRLRSMLSLLLCCTGVATAGVKICVQIVPVWLYLAMCPGPYAIGLLAYEKVLLPIIGRSEFGSVPITDRDAMEQVIVQLRLEENRDLDPLHLASGQRSLS